EPATAEAAAEADSTSSAETPAPAAPEPPAPAAPPPVPAPVAAGTENGKTFVSPVVARIAAEHGVDPSSVQGTGEGGRVTKKDILAFIESGATAAPSAPAAPAEPSAPTPAAAPAPARQPQVAGAGEQLEPMNAMRKGIAEHMRRSLDTAAHVTSAI